MFEFIPICIIAIWIIAMIVSICISLWFIGSILQLQEQVDQLQDLYEELVKNESKNDKGLN